MPAFANITICESLDTINVAIFNSDNEVIDEVVVDSADEAVATVKSVGLSDESIHYDWE